MKRMSSQFPSDEAWSRLLEELRQAREQQKRGIDEPRLPHGLLPHLRWVKAFHDFLVLVDPDLGTLPFKLMEAMADLQYGNRSPLFEPERPTSRPIHLVWEAQRIAMAVRAVDELVKAGRGLKAAARQARN
jgi:hypothetical protein